jgi:nucleotide-binding universal stress UspA family protein
LAKRKEAHLIGVSFALESSLFHYYGEKIAPDLISSQHEALKDAAKKAILQFEQVAKAAGISHEGRIVECSTVDIAEKLAFEGRHTDMTFLEQPNPDRKNRQLLASLLDCVLFNTGRPVYIVPYVGRRELSVRKAVIAWDGSHKAARAVNDAIPLLQARGEAVVLVIDPERRPKSHGEKPGADIAAHLERHGINTSVEKYPSGEFGVATTILNFISDGGGDLLVMGGYGHSKVRERAFGGVTRTILEQMTVPVLMSN